MMEPVASHDHHEEHIPEEVSRSSDVAPVDARTPADGAALEKRATAASAASVPETYPEGGTAAWLVVMGGWFALFSGMGTLNTLATWQAYVLNHQLKDYSEGTVGWIFSVYTFLTFFCGIYIGPIFDKYGPRWLVIAGGVLLVTSFVSLSFCTQYWHFMVCFGVLSGFATSLLLTPSIASIGHWFKARRGFTTSIATSAGGLGGIIFPFMLTNLWDKIGFGWGTRVLALISLMTSIIGVCFIRSRLPPAANATAHPDFLIFKQLAFTLTTLGIFLLEFSLFIPLAYISTYAMAKNFSTEFSYQLLPIMNAGSVVGRLLPGYYSDIIGAFNTCILASVLCVIATLGVWLPVGHTTPGIVIFAILFGLGSGIGIAIAPVCISRLCKTQEYGRYYATAYMCVSFACLIGIPIAGNILQAGNGSYVGLIVTTGVIFAASAVCLVWAKVYQLGWSGLLKGF